MAGRDPQLPQEGTDIRQHSFEKTGHVSLSSRNRGFHFPFKISSPFGFTDKIKATQSDVTA
jgi:hypothetical protein